MKKKFWILNGISAVVMLGLPFLAVNLAPGDAGMAICFLLFFGVNPLYSLILGVVTGMDVKALWPVPVVSALLFLAGCWIFFDPSEPLFLTYGIVYLVVSLLAIFLGRFLGKVMQ